MSIFYPDLEEQTPQLIELIINIYDLNLTRNWLPLERRPSRGRKNQLPPDWATLLESPRFRSNVVDILKIFRSLTTGFIRGVQNPLSGDALDRASQSEPGSEPSLFLARPLGEHNRSDYFIRSRGGAKFTFTPLRILNLQKCKKGSKKTRIRRKLG
jgi:hypothetical protein